MSRNTNNLTLVVDSQDNYADALDVFNLKPEKLHLTKCLDNERFTACRIENCPVDRLTPLVLSNLLNKLVPDAPVSVIVCQPITVMQDFDAKQVVANAQLAGFEGVDEKAVDVKDGDYKYRSIKVTFYKPERKADALKVDKVVIENANNLTSSKVVSKK
jgi:hypothetical protein